MILLTHRQRTHLTQLGDLVGSRYGLAASRHGPEPGEGTVQIHAGVLIILVSESARVREHLTTRRGRATAMLV